ncbi:MAG TPA: hypothetical protein DDW65_21565 [Firmicutes bacterium]|jgi:hypothetical protein|nr:hypothetical protein [Bacillota bacterium]
MYEPWQKDGKSGNIQFPKGEVVYQQPKGTIKVEPIYVDNAGKYYIEVDGRLQEALMNPFNGYCYRQDGL